MEGQNKTRGFLSANPLLRGLLFWFALLAVLLHLAMALHLYLRTGFAAAPLVEIYAGSEVATRLFPGYPDHFRPARSLAGLLKIHVWHFFAIPFFAFVLIHLLLAIRPSRLLAALAWFYGVSVVFLLLAPFSFFLSAQAGLYFYYMSFVLFEASGLALSLALTWSLAVVNRIDVVV